MFVTNTTHESRARLHCSYRRQNFLTQQVDLLIPVGVAEAQIEDDVVEAGFFVAFGIAGDIRRSSRHEQPFDIRNR